jgi:hypothetical protein
MLYLKDSRFNGWSQCSSFFFAALKGVMSGAYRQIRLQPLTAQLAE